MTQSTMCQHGVMFMTFYQPIINTVQQLQLFLRCVDTIKRQTNNERLHFIPDVAVQTLTTFEDLNKNWSTRRAYTR